MSEFEKILKKPEVGGTLNHLIAAHEWELRGQGWLAAVKHFEKIENAYICKAAMRQEIDELKKDTQ